MLTTQLTHQQYDIAQSHPSLNPHAFLTAIVPEIRVNRLIGIVPRNNECCGWYQVSFQILGQRTYREINMTEKTTKRTVSTTRNMVAGTLR